MLQIRSKPVIALSLVAGLLTTGLAAPALASASATSGRAAPALDGPCTQVDYTVTCTFDPGLSSWTVPTGIVPDSYVGFQAQGQGGQTANGNGIPSRGGGEGATVNASFQLAPGTQLQLRRPGTPDDGHGGGRGFDFQGYHPASGGGGGLAGVWQQSAGGLQTLIIAGGGGGEGQGSFIYPGSFQSVTLRGGIGGNAGLPGAAAGPGGNGEGYGGLGPGGGGGSGGATPGRGGLAAVFSRQGDGPYNISCAQTATPAGAPGLNESGGAAQGDSFGIWGASGGGGGAGYTGGGSGAAGGIFACELFNDPTPRYFTGAGAGGGGASYLAPQALNASAQLSAASYESAGGLVITYTVSPPDITAPVPALSSVSTPRSGPVSQITWNYGEAVNHYPGMTLTRDGAPVDLSLAGIIDSFDNSTGGRYLADQTTEPGTYVFTLLAAGIADLAGNAVPADVSVTWVNTLSASFTAVDTPRDVGVDSIPLTFSAPVTGVDLTDFEVFRDGIPIPLQQGATLTGSGADYVLGNLGDLTAAETSPVGWEFVLPVSGTGIVSAGGYSLNNPADVMFTVDQATPPTASFAAVDTPRATGVDSIVLTFSQPVFAVDISDFEIFRDGIPTALTGATVTATGRNEDGASATYLVDNLGDLTSPELYPVSWELVLKGSGTSINNEQDILFTGGASVAFDVDASPPPVATFGAVDTPRATGVDEIPVTFSDPVFAVDVSDFRIFRDGVPTSLAGATLTGSGANYVLGNLGDLTAPELYAVSWEIELVADGSNITNEEGAAFVNDADVSFDVQPAAPPVATFAAVSSPRSTALDEADLSFSVPVFGVDIADFSLTRNGTDVPLASAALTGSGAAYAITGLAPLTQPGDGPADYVLSLHDSGTTITSDEGVALAGGAAVAFTIEARPPGTLTTTTTLTSSALADGKKATLTATVRTTGTDPPPITGTVTFSVAPMVGRSFTCLSGPIVTVAAGVAQCTLPAHTMRAGNADYAVTATYSGDTNYVDSDGALTLHPPGTATSLSVDTTVGAKAGKPVTLTITVLHPPDDAIVSGNADMIVLDSLGNPVRCGRYWLLRSHSQFGCRIPAASALPGTYTVIAIYDNSYHYYFSDIVQNVTLP